MTISTTAIPISSTNPDADAMQTRIVAALASGAFIAFGIICWIAANWASFHRLTKLGLVGCVLLGSCAVAAIGPRVRIPALIVATATIGGLLALLGQIYPSGADAWQLFFYWALLALPFAVAARHDVVWSFWTVIAIAAIQLWNAQERNFETGSVQDWAPAWCLAIVLALGLFPTSYAARLIGGTRSAFRIAAVAAIGLVLTTAIFAILEKHEAVVFLSLTLLGLCIAAMTRMRPLDQGLLAIAMLAFDVLLIWRLAELFAPSDDSPGAMLLISFIAIGVVCASVIVLRRLGLALPYGQSAAASGSSERSTWPVAVLSGFGAIMAAVPLLGFYWSAFDWIIRVPGGTAAMGLATAGVAIFVMRRSAPLGFMQMLGAIGVTVGLALIGWSLSEALDENLGFALFAIGIVAATLIPVTWARNALGFASSAAFLISVALRTMPGQVTALAIILSVVATLGGAAVLLRGHTIRDDRLNRLVREAQGFLSGFAVACVIALMGLAGRPFMIVASGILGELHGDLLAPATSAARTVSVALALAAAGLILIRRPAFRSPAAFALAGVAIVFSARSPMLGAGLFVLACAIVAQARALAAFAALAVLWIVSAAYYSLSWTLSEKAWSMIGLGSVLIVVLLASGTRLKNASSTRGEEPALLRTRLLIGAGMLATGVLCTFATVTAEDILRHGRTVFIALRPIDPRSLLQGDYMAVAFATERLPTPSSLQNREVFGIASLDSRSIATLQRIANTHETKRDDEIALQLRTKSRRWFVGSDAWYFEEGRGKPFEAAKFGSFRIGANGRPLLVGLVDAELRPIP